MGSLHSSPSLGKAAEQQWSPLSSFFSFPSWLLQLLATRSGDFLATLYQDRLTWQTALANVLSAHWSSPNAPWRVGKGLLRNVDFSETLSQDRLTLPNAWANVLSAHWSLPNAPWSVGKGLLRNGDFLATSSQDRLTLPNALENVQSAHLSLPNAP